MTYTLHLGDCLEIMPTLEAGSIDAIITDIPYGTTACKWDTIIPFADMWREVKQVLKPNGVFITTASQPFTSALVMSNPKMFKYEWIWEKVRPSNPMLAKVRALKVHENILIFGSGKTKYFPQDLLKTNKPRGGQNPSKTQLGFGANVKKKYVQEFYNYPKTILRFGTDNSKNVHPTQKPVSLYEYLIKTYTNESETVLDIAMGSGTTGIACGNTNRIFIGIEKDPDIFKIAENRLSGMF